MCFRTEKGEGGLVQLFIQVKGERVSFANNLKLENSSFFSLILIQLTVCFRKESQRQFTWCILMPQYTEKVFASSSSYLVKNFPVCVIRKKTLSVMWRNCQMEGNV